MAETTRGEHGWETYVQPIEVTAEMEGGSDSPEAAVVCFYASRLRGDAGWRSVLEEPPSESMERKLEKLAGWSFRGVRLVGRRARSKGRWYIRIEQDVTIDGREDSAVNEVSVTQDPPGRFRVARVPT